MIKSLGILIFIFFLLFIIGVTISLLKRKERTEFQKNDLSKTETLKTDDSGILKEYLTEKYRLAEEMARLAGGSTGLEELKKQNKADRPIYREKLEELRQCLEEYEKIKRKAVDIKKKGELSNKEKEYCRLLEIENENEELWKGLLDE